MISPREIVRVGTKLATDNSPAILTGFGIVGVIGTAVLTGKASIKAQEIIAQENVRRGMHNNRVGELQIDRVSNREKVELTWQEFVPPVTTGVFTITAIVMANRIGTRRTAAFAAAYTLSEKAASEYRDKVVEQIGKTKEQKVRDSLAQDQITNQPPSTGMVVVADEVIFREAFTGRYFKSTMEDVKQAVNRVNHHMINNFSADLNDFYDFVGLDRTDMGDLLGWNSDKLIELEFSTCMDDRQRPAISFTYKHPPRESYFRTTL